MNDLCLQKAIEVRDGLAAAEARIVLAESCTAGRVSGSLAVLPGISQWLCGRFVVYRCDSKTRWLGIPPTLLSDPQIGPVSRETSNLLASAALGATPEARFGLAVTGDVGPGAPQATDGVVFIALHDRLDGNVYERSVSLSSPPPMSASSIDERVARLNEATLAVLEHAAIWIRASTSKDPHA